MGQAGDVLVAFALRPDDALLAAVVGAAHEREMSALVIAGREPGGSAPARAGHAAITAETDIWITVPHERPARICELQLLTLHALCDAVDLQLLGDADL